MLDVQPLVSSVQEHVLSLWALIPIILSLSLFAVYYWWGVVLPCLALPSLLLPSLPSLSLHVKCFHDRLIPFLRCNPALPESEAHHRSGSQSHQHRCVDCRLPPADHIKDLHAATKVSQLCNLDSSRLCQNYQQQICLSILGNPGWGWG